MLVFIFGLEMHLREATASDLEQVLALYRRTALTPGGLARLEHEIDSEYVAVFMNKALDFGVSLVAVADKRIIGEIHAYKPGQECFAHVFSELTIAVDPLHQAKGVGRKLFEAFMRKVIARPDVLRVELIARESNQKAIRFYESLGFVQEGRLENRIRNLDGSFEADIPMAWGRRKRPFA